LLLLTGLLGIGIGNNRTEADFGFPLYLGAGHPKSLNLFFLFPELSASFGTPQSSQKTMRSFGRGLPKNPRKALSRPTYFTVSQIHQRSFPVKKLVPTTLEQIHSQANACLDTLIKQVSSDAPPADSWNRAHKALEALPLTTEEAAVMRNRLANARNYLEAGERGAARYELRLLACNLANK
jgi:hypothetical protein